MSSYPWRVDVSVKQKYHGNVTIALKEDYGSRTPPRKPLGIRLRMRDDASGSLLEYLQALRAYLDDAIYAVEQNMPREEMSDAALTESTR